MEKRGDAWWVVDLGSTNGVKVDTRYVTDAMLSEADELQVGNFTPSHHRGESRGAPPELLHVPAQPRGVPRGPPHRERALRTGAPTTAATPRERVLKALAQVARTLLEVEALEPVLEKVMEALFDQLPAERGLRFSLYVLS